MEDFLVAYKEAIKAQYEVAKDGDDADCLLYPTLAKLRKLCLRILKNDPIDNDKKIFEKFFEFDLGPDSIKKIKNDENKFKRFEKFLKNQTDLSDDIYAMDFLAVLVDYEYRPFSKFKKHFEIPPEAKRFEEESIGKKKDNNDENNNQNRLAEEITPKPTVSKSILKRKVLIMSLIVITFFSVGYVTKDFCFPTKNCMQWQDDHYEVVDCEVNGLATISPILALDKDIVGLKRVTLKKGMEFFKYKKPLYYYYKVSQDSVEFFNAPGLHPITNEPLKKITQHMIDKYVK